MESTEQKLHVTACRKKKLWHNKCTYKFSNVDFNYVMFNHHHWIKKIILFTDIDSLVILKLNM